MRKSIVTVLAALAFTGVTAPAAANVAAPAETVSVAVEYGDLDIATPPSA